MNSLQDYENFYDSNHLDRRYKDNMDSLVGRLGLWIWINDLNFCWVGFSKVKLKGTVQRFSHSKIDAQTWT